LKDLRIDDTGNYTCQVFNKYGFINTTYEINVYDESQIFEGIDPVNSTIRLGQDATFTCKVKNDLVSTIQWLKLITKKEYDDYVLEKYQEHKGSDDKLSTFINSFFSPLNSENNINNKIDGTHYITIKDENENQEKLLISNVYINKLTIKNSTSKDNGVYICFGVTSNGYSYRKAYLNVVVDDVLPTISTPRLILLNGYTIKLNNLFIIIIPFMIISLFSIISIVYLKLMQKKSTKFHKIIFKFFKFNHKNTNSEAKNYYLPVLQPAPPLPTSKPPTSSERQFNEYIHPKQQQDLQSDDSQTGLILSTSNNNTSSLSSTSTYLIPQSVDPSTTTTTLVSSNDSSIIYYKVLDFGNNEQQSKIFDLKKKFFNKKNHDELVMSDAKTVVSNATSNSRFYYQLNSDNDGK
jgi:hypothetical protein